MDTKSKRPITPALLDIAVLGGVAVWALLQMRRMRRARRALLQPVDTIQTWEGEGGNVVASQPGDAVEVSRRARGLTA